MYNKEGLKTEADFLNHSIDMCEIEDLREIITNLEKIPFMTSEFDKMSKHYIYVMRDQLLSLLDYQEKYYHCDIDKMNDKESEELDILLEKLYSLTSMNSSLFSVMISTIQEFFKIIDHIKSLDKTINLYTEDGHPISLIENNYYEYEWIAFNIQEDKFLGHNKSRKILREEIKDNLNGTTFFYCEGD